MTIPTWTAGFRPAVVRPHGRVPSHAFGEQASGQSFDAQTIRATGTGKGGK